MDSSPRSSRRHGRQHCNNGRRVGDLIKQIEHFDQLSISTEHEFCYPESSLRLKEPIGMLSDARSTSRETRILDPSIIQVRRVDALRRLRRNNSDSIYQNQSVGPFSSDSKRAYSKNRVLNHQESRMMNMSGGRQCSEQCYVKCRNGKESEKYSRDIPLISLRGETVESNCFGRSTYTPEKLSREGVSFSGNLTSQTSLRDVQHRERNLGKSTPQTSSHEVPSRGGIGFSGCGSSETHLESKKSNRSLRKFSCMSSADVLPTLTLTTGSRNTPHIHNGQKRNRNSRESRQVISFLARSTGCVPRQISHREGLLPEAHSLSNMEQSVSPTELSLLPDSNDCSVRQNTISFGSIVSSSTEMQERHNDHGNERNINTPTCSLNSSEATTQVSFDENGGTFVAVHGRDIVRNIGEVDVEERTEVDSRSSQSSINISTGYISTSVTSNMIDPSSSTSRNGHITSNSLYEQMQNHTEALEDISFPSSCMSSPDGHQPADSSTFHSHDLRQMLSSSQYYQMGYHGRSARATQYRPFRRFPLRSYEENEEYLTFGGSSEVSLRSYYNILKQKNTKDPYFLVYLPKPLVVRRPNKLGVVGMFLIVNC